MVSLDPHHVQQTGIELPLWKWGLPDQSALALEDLLGGDRFALHGKYHTVTLTPQQPYLIWRATPLS
jgi:starch synthase (maltosyl-transferring)